MARTPKEDATALLNMLLPFAEQMLREHGEFFPFGGAMLPDGSMTMIGATDGTDRPRSKTLIDLMEQKFQQAARRGEYRATGIAYDVRTTPPGSTEKTDAIAVRLDHEHGYSEVVMIPYRLVAGAVVKGTIFALKGEHSIFPVH